MAHSSSSLVLSAGRPREISEEWGEAQLHYSLLSLYFDLVTLKAEPVSRQGRHSCVGSEGSHPASSGACGDIGGAERV